jgi:hypothetical protein
MDDAEKIPIVSVATPITPEESTTCRYCSCPCCNDKCAVTLVVIFAISILMFLAAGLMYTISDSPSSPMLLCADSFTSTVKLVSYICAGSIFFLCLVICCCRNFCDSRGDPCSCCPCFELVLVSCFFLVVLSLLICSVLLNFRGMNMIVQSSTNEMIYRCELDPANPDAHLIVFSPFGQMTSNPNQVCEFRSTTSLCGSFISLFAVLEQLVEIDGTKGAYWCPESSPEGHDVCVSFLNFTQIFLYIQNVLAFVSVTLFIASIIWIERRDRSDECARRCDCFRSRGPRYKLSSMTLTSVFGDQYHAL